MKSSCCNRCKYIFWHSLFSIWALMVLFQMSQPTIPQATELSESIFFPKIVLKYCLLTTERLSTLLQSVLSFVSKCSRANLVISMTESHLLLMQCHLSAQRSQASNSDFQYWFFLLVLETSDKNGFMRFVNHYILFYFTHTTFWNKWTKERTWLLLSSERTDKDKLWSDSELVSFPASNNCYLMFASKTDGKQVAFALSYTFSSKTSLENTVTFHNPLVFLTWTQVCLFR